MSVNGVIAMDSGWCIAIKYRNRDGRFLAGWTFARTRKQAINKFINGRQAYRWKKAYRQGHRAVRVVLHAAHHNYYAPRADQ